MYGTGKYPYSSRKQLIPFFVRQYTLTYTERLISPQYLYSITVTPKEVYNQSMQYEMKRSHFNHLFYKFI